jgi:hypothetical protein
MGRLSEEMSVIPTVAWVLAVVCWLGSMAFVTFGISRADDGPWAFWALLVTVPPLFFAIWILLIGYVNGDARRRGMRHVMWTLLAIFIPNAIGIILYFIMREPPMKNCPKCGTAVRGGFGFCQACGAPIAQSCANCRGALEPGWSHCPNCGKGLKAA